MPRRVWLPRWLAFNRTKPAIVFGLVLFVASDTMDLIFYRLGVPPGVVILNDAAIGILGAMLLLFYLSASYESQNFARAKERMILIAELNHHIRSALVAIESSAMLEDRAERLRRVEEATDRIESVLIDLVPTIGSAEKPRYSLPEQKR